MFLIHLDEFRLLLLLLWGKWKQMNTMYEWIIEYIVFQLCDGVCVCVCEGKSNITLEFH